MYILVCENGLIKCDKNKTRGQKLHQKKKKNYPNKMTCMTGDTSHKKLRANVTLISSDIMTVFMKSASKDLSWHKIYANWSM